MINRTIFLTGIITAVLAFHACTLPSSVIIKGNPNVSVPVKINAVDFNDFMLEKIKDATENQDIVVLNYTNYYNSGKNIQTFLLQFPLIEDYNIGFGSEFQKITNFDFDLETDHLEQEFDVGDLGNLNNAIGAIPVPVDLQPMFDNIRDNINDELKKQIAVSVPFPITGGLLPGDLPEFKTGFIIDMVVMDSVEFGSGVFEVTITAKGSELNGLDISFDNLQITDGENTIPGFVDPGFTDPRINLTEINQTQTVYFNLTGKKLKKNFGLQFELKDDKSTWPCFRPLPPFNTIDIEIKPAKLDNLKFKSIIGLKLAPSDLPIDSTGLPAGALDISMASLRGPGSRFVHAKIGTGTLEFEIDLPDEKNDIDSYFTGFDITPGLYLLQEHSIDRDLENWQGINNSNAILPSPPAPWHFNQKIGVLDNKHINTSDIKILDIRTSAYESKITLRTPAAGADFWLSTTDMNNEKVTINVKPKLDIDIFEVVHADIRDDFNANKPVIQPISLTDAAKYLKSIWFTRVGPKITFGQIDIPGLEVMFSIPELGINPGQNNQAITSGAVLEFINETPYPPGKELKIIDSSGTQLISDLNIDFDIQLAGTKNVVGIPNIIPSSNQKLKMQVLDIDFIYEWEKAVLDLSSIATVKNYFPGQKADLTPDTIDMSEVNKYLKGFHFNHAIAQLYTRGPSVLFGLKPEIEMMFKYTDNNGMAASDDLMGNSSYLIESLPFDLDPGNTGIYTGGMPPGGLPIENFHTLMEKEPNDLYFYYEINLPDEIEVTPADLGNIDLSKNLDAEILIIVPLILTAGPNGADLMLPDMPDDMDDILNREKSGDSLPLDFIKSLTLNLELTDDMFTSGKFFLDDSIKRMEFPLSGKSVGLSISGGNLDYINKTIPYKPDIGFHFPRDSVIQISRNIGTIKLNFEAEIEYRINFDDL
jgi:hypothetical protein